jgi:hypothetical protein
MADSKPSHFQGWRAKSTCLHGNAECPRRLEPKPMSSHRSCSPIPVSRPLTFAFKCVAGDNRRCGETLLASVWIFVFVLEEVLRIVKLLFDELVFDVFMCRDEMKHIFHSDVK